MTAVRILAENPLFPPEYDGAWTALTLLITLFMVGALYDVMRSPRATMIKAVEWVVLIVLVPIVGPSIWFLYGRRRFN